MRKTSWMANRTLPNLPLSVTRSPSASICFSSAEGFLSVDDFLRSSETDAVLIATPHYSHTTIGIRALEAGQHVLVEKPISVHKADAERLIAAHDGSDQVFAAMFNQRTDPFFLKLRQLVQSGELGCDPTGKLDDYQLVPNGGLLSVERLESYLGRRGRRRVAEPVSTQSRSVPMDLWNACQSPRVLPFWPVSRYRSRRRRDRISRVFGRDDGRIQRFHRGGAGYQPTRSGCRTRQSRDRK